MQRIQIKRIWFFLPWKQVNPWSRHSEFTYQHEIGRNNHPITDEFTESESGRSQNLRDSLNEALHLLLITTYSETKKALFERHFGRKPRTKLIKFKNVISVDSKEISVYITRSSTGEIMDNLVMSK